MDDHAGEEDGVEPRERAIEAGDQAPGNGEVGITGVVDLASVAVPSIDEDRVSRFSLDGAGVLDCLPWELGEGLSLGEGSTFLGTEAILLRVGGVPDPVHEEVGSEKSNQKWGSEGVAVEIIQVVCHIQSAVTVSKRYTSQVPENQHEAPFLVVHIPKKVSGR